ncbi:hypothetical protein QE152_g26666 [Popillia japonica]|uniref:Uncharacterized protein n=1 Tax=Popillia japonica TaxID=7064 RepID=A0AAW1JY01_POPJA
MRLSYKTYSAPKQQQKRTGGDGDQRKWRNKRETTWHWNEAAGPTRRCNPEHLCLKAASRRYAHASASEGPTTATLLCCLPPARGTFCPV